MNPGRGIPYFDVRDRFLWPQVRHLRRAILCKLHLIRTFFWAFCTTNSHARKEFPFFIGRLEFLFLVALVRDPSNRN